jgi:hypothetical protein
VAALMNGFVCTVQATCMPMAAVEWSERVSSRINQLLSSSTSQDLQRIPLLLPHP